MSRATEFPEEERPLRSETTRGGDDGGDGGERSVVKAPKPSFPGRVGEFYHNIKLEMSKTTWPTRNEVWSTTVIVLIAVVFFGFYLWGIDKLVTMGFEALESWARGLG